MPAPEEALRLLAADPVVQVAVAEASSMGATVHLVGGAVRDALLGRESKDLDLVVALEGEAAASAGVAELPAPMAGVSSAGAPALLALARTLAGRLRATCVPLDRARGIARLVLKDGRSLDLALQVGPTLEHDLRRRDFTINAMALQPGDVTLVDPTGGGRDLQAMVLRPAGPGSLLEDPLRCLRAVRLLCQLLHLQPTAGLEEDLRLRAPLLRGVSPERVREELFLALRAGLSPRLGLLERTGLLLQVLPELEAAGRTEQNHYHHLNVLDHTLEVVRRLEALEARGFEDLTSHPGALREHLAAPLAGGRSALQLLKLAALLHDVAKPRTASVDGRGRIRFCGHDLQGAWQAEGIGRRLALSNREIRRMVRVIVLHLQPLLLSPSDPTDVELHRMFRDAGEAAPDLLVLSAADSEASRGPAQTPEHLEIHRRFVVEMLDEFFQEGRLARPKIPITGADLVDTFGLEPGPGVGRLLAGVAEAVAEGAVRTREEALDRAAQLLLATER